MERIHALVDKLKQQTAEGQSPAQLLLTVQLLHSELLKQQQNKSTFGTAKVAVVLPMAFNAQAPSAPLVETPPPAAAPEVPQQQPAQESPSPYALRKPVVEDKAPPPAKQPAAQGSFYAAFETSQEAPTLAQHQPSKAVSEAKEIHELIGEGGESLNDRLKEEKKEIASRLQDTPIKDLRKGIGINDRFTFVNELFRGDEAMYERSIKTINGFNILSEAEYWISRELKLKLGWNDTSETVQHFYQLVRRRFS
jgi:hypothetical protein